MILPVYNSLGVNLGRDIELNSGVFSVSPNEHVVYLDIKNILAGRRQGTHKSKEKSDVSGSTRKLRKQKGSGMARVGSIKSPIFKGGARIFGPRPRSYDFKVNKKVKHLARKSVLSYKCSAGDLVILDSLNLDSFKTRNYVKFLENFSLSSSKTLLLLEQHDRNVVLASRNLSNTKVIDVRLINTYDLLNADTILIEERALPVIYKLLI